MFNYCAIKISSSILFRSLALHFTNIYVVYGELLIVDYNFMVYINVLKANILWPKWKKLSTQHRIQIEGERYNKKTTKTTCTLYDCIVDCHWQHACFFTSSRNYFTCILTNIHDLDQIILVCGHADMFCSLWNEAYQMCSSFGMDEWYFYVIRLTIAPYGTRWMKRRLSPERKKVRESEREWVRERERKWGRKKKWEKVK